MESKKVKEILEQYNVDENAPLFIIQGNMHMDVTWRYLKGGWSEVLESKVLNFGKLSGKIIFEIEEP